MQPGPRGHTCDHGHALAGLAIQVHAAASGRCSQKQQARVHDVAWRDGCLELAAQRRALLARRIKDIYLPRQQLSSGFRVWCWPFCASLLSAALCSPAASNTSTCCASS